MSIHATTILTSHVSLLTPKFRHLEMNDASISKCQAALQLQRGCVFKNEPYLFLTEIMTQSAQTRHKTAVGIARNCSPECAIPIHRPVESNRVSYGQSISTSLPCPSTSERCTFNGILFTTRELCFEFKQGTRNRDSDSCSTPRGYWTSR
jgi:hypothetical protein